MRLRSQNRRTESGAATRSRGGAQAPSRASGASENWSLLDPTANREASVSARKLAAESFSMEAVLDTLLPIYEGIRH